MGKMQKTKGTAGEQELCRELRLHLGDAVVLQLQTSYPITKPEQEQVQAWINSEITRNLNQPRDGGSDHLAGNYAIEVKRHKKPTIWTWWIEACEKAELAGKYPVLAYRLDHQKWCFKIPLGCLHPDFKPEAHGLTATLDIQSFTAILRGFFVTRWLELHQATPAASPEALPEPESLEDEQPGIR